MRLDTFLKNAFVFDAFNKYSMVFKYGLTKPGYTEEKKTALSNINAAYKNDEKEKTTQLSKNTLFKNEDSFSLTSINMPESNSYTKPPLSSFTSGLLSKDTTTLSGFGLSSSPLSFYSSSQVSSFYINSETESGSSFIDMFA